MQEISALILRCDDLLKRRQAMNFKTRFRTAILIILSIFCMSILCSCGDGEKEIQTKSSDTLQSISSSTDPSGDNGNAKEQKMLESIDELLHSDEFMFVRQRANTVETEKEKKDLIEKTEGIFQEWQKKGFIQEYCFNEKMSQFEFRFTECLPFIMHIGALEEGILGSGSDESKVSESNIESSESDTQINVKNDDMLIVTAFDETDESYSTGIKALEGQYKNSNQDGRCDVIYNAKINDFKKFGDYGTVVVMGHGGIDQDNDLLISTGEKYTTLFGAYHILKDIMTEEAYYEVDTEDYTISLNSSFFDDHYPEGSLEGTVIYWASCHGYENDSLANVFFDAGAEAFIGFDNTVSVFYSDCMLNSVMEWWFSGLSLQDALMEAEENFGTNDTCFLLRIFDKLTENEAKELNDHIPAYIKYNGSNMDITYRYQNQNADDLFELKEQLIKVARECFSNPDVTAFEVYMVGKSPEAQHYFKSVKYSDVLWIDTDIENKKIGIYRNDGIYYGPVDNGMRCSGGAWYYDFNLYYGEWKNDKPNGKGCFLIDDTYLIQADFIDGIITNGNAQFNYKDGTKLTINDGKTSVTKTGPDWVDISIDNGKFVEAVPQNERQKEAMAKTKPETLVLAFYENGSFMITYNFSKKHENTTRVDGLELMNRLLYQKLHEKRPELFGEDQ